MHVDVDEAPELTDEELDVLVTPRGPVLAPGAARYAVALRAVWLDPLPVVGFLRAWKARSSNWSPENGTYMSPSMSAAASPASASARSVACAAIS